MENAKTIRDATGTRIVPGLWGWPWHGWIGLGLTVLFWAINWGLEGLRTHWAFFPLWLGYCLVMDALVFQKTGKSPMTAHRLGFAWLFLISSPGWWIFEFFNARTHYWEYIPLDSFSTVEYYLYCSLNFTIVMPAVFLTAEWVNTWHMFRRPVRGPVFGKSRRTEILLFCLGWIMLAAMLLWPEYGMAFMWMTLFFILDPVNRWQGRLSILSRTAKGSWHTVAVLWTAVLICGFFWEFWNYFSSPKWIYHVPFVDVLHLFEMPALGYLGYLPFALELFAMYSLLSGVFPRLNFDFTFLKT